MVYQSRSIDARGDGGIGWDLMKQIPLTLWRWTRAEYDRLVGGQLVVAEPQGSYHASALGTAGDALRAVLPQGWPVRIQMPVALDDESESEPDLAVVTGTWSVGNISPRRHRSPASWAPSP